MKRTHPPLKPRVITSHLGRNGIRKRWFILVRKNLPGSVRKKHQCRNGYSMLLISHVAVNIEIELNTQNNTSP